MFIVHFHKWLPLVCLLYAVDLVDVFADHYHDHEDVAPSLSRVVVILLDVLVVALLTLVVVHQTGVCQMIYS